MCSLHGAQWSLGINIKTTSIKTWWEQESAKCPTSNRDFTRECPHWAVQSFLTNSRGPFYLTALLLFWEKASLPPASLKLLFKLLNHFYGRKGWSNNSFNLFNAEYWALRFTNIFFSFNLHHCSIRQVLKTPLFKWKKMRLREGKGLTTRHAWGWISLC